MMDAVTKRIITILLVFTFGGVVGTVILLQKNHKGALALPFNSSSEKDDNSLLSGNDANNPSQNTDSSGNEPLNPLAVPPTSTTPKTTSR